MTKRPTRITTITAITAALLAIAATASAHPLRGAWGDDEPALRAHGTHWASNASGWWQNVLCADRDFNGYWVDAYFANATRDRTIPWQRHRGLTADGVVGRQTYQYTQQWVFQNKIHDTGSVAFYRYDGSRHDFHMYWWDYHGATTWHTQHIGTGVSHWQNDPYRSTEFNSRDGGWTTVTC